jgi:apocytochrome f
MVRQKYISFFLFPFFFLFSLIDLRPCLAFPIYAQQAYENPREANGRIVCANCHLAQKPTEFEAPISVLPDTVFETVVKIPYDTNAKQILGNGQKGGLNVGAVVLLPEGFTLAPKKRLEESIKEKMKGIYITPYSPIKENILVVGPIAGEKHQEIVFPVLAPDQTKSIAFAKYPIYVGANRGRGQVYPTGEKTNNNIVTAIVGGKIQEIKINSTTKNTEIVFLSLEGETKEQIVPAGVELVVQLNQVVKQDQLLTVNPNVGGFGQSEVEIVLQDPNRIYGYVAFCFVTLIAQSMFVFKKRQYEKVQLAELNF